jgi:hypothetical protein
VNWSIIVPNLSVMTNGQPIVFGQGYGGGAPVVPLLPGIPFVSGQPAYPSLGLPPFNFPASPVGIPIQCCPNVNGGGISSPATLGSVNTNSIAIGSFVFVVLTFDAVQNTTVTFTNVTDNATGGSNSYTIIQPPAVAGNNTIAIAYCFTTNPLPAGSQWTISLSPLFQVNVQLLGAFYRPPPPSGSTSVRVSSSATAASSVSGLSTSLSVVAGDLIIGAARTNSYSEMVAPAGFTNLVSFVYPVGGYEVFSLVAPTTGSLTVNPTWTGSLSRGDLIVGAFANANIAT